MIRALTIAGVFVLLVAAVRADDEKADVSISVPKEVEFKAAKVAGGDTATFQVKIAVKNTGTEKLPFSRHMLKFEIQNAKGKPVVQPLGWTWDKPGEKVRDLLVVDAGKTHDAAATFTFNTGLPKDGEPFTVVLKLYGQTHKAMFKAKVK